MNNYTGRLIGIITDIHGLFEPTRACLEDMKRRGITEIYSLGDNVGVGPSPDKVIDILSEYNVKSIAGNNEDYITLGIEPFRSFFTSYKEESLNYTIFKLNSYELGIINLYPHFIDLVVGGKQVGLCHFANDVRCDFNINSTWTYQLGRKDAYKQFLYTNSDEQKQEIIKEINYLGKDSNEAKGYVSALNDPLFNGKKVTDYDFIFQGHVHFEIIEKGKNTLFYTLRALGMGYGKEPIDTAYYLILKERNSGFDIEKVLVKFNRKYLEEEINNSDGPMDTIKDFVHMR